MSQIQTQQELDDFYKNPDPWAYKSNPDDIRRRHELLACLPNNKYQRVLDIGCGNGFLTSQLPGSEVIGVDLSASAVDWAKESVSEVADSSRFKFQQASIFELKSEKLGKFDLIISNPPYIKKSDIETLEPEVSIYEPYIALDGGDDGLGCYRRLAPQIMDLLNKCGYAVFEFGKRQHDDVRAIFEYAGMRFVSFGNDISSEPRCVVFSR